MRRRTLRDFPEVVELEQATSALQSKLNDVHARQSEIAETLRRRALNNDIVACLVDDYVEPPISLREEQRRLADIERELTRTQADAPSALRLAIAKASKSMVDEVRPEVLKQVQRIIPALRTIAEANAALEALRNELERAGFVTGRLPDARFLAVDQWHNVNGGTVTFYRKFIGEIFPELDDELK